MICRFWARKSTYSGDMSIECTYGVRVWHWCRLWSIKQQRREPMSTPQTNKTAGSHIQDPAVTLWGSGCTCRTHPGARPPTAGGAVCVRRRCGRNRLEHHSVDPQLTCLVGLAHKTYHEAPRCQVTRCTTKSQLPPNLAGRNSSDRQAQKHDEPIWPLHRRRKTVLARFTHGVNYVYSPDDQRFIHALGPGHGSRSPHRCQPAHTL